MNPHLTEAATMIPNAFVVRQATPGDIPALQAFVAGLSTTTRASRFFVPLRELPPMLTQALQDRDPMHHFLVARAVGRRKSAGASSDTTADATCNAAAQATAGTCPEPEGPIVALAQYARRPPPALTCEIALVIADAFQKQGLGRQLMQQLLADAQGDGLDLAVGDVLRQNRAMLALARSVDFSLKRHPDDQTLVQVARSLRREPAPADSLPASRAGRQRPEMLAAA